MARAIARAALLWAANRRGVAAGLAIGLFFAFLLPIGQSLAAGAIAIWLRANLPVAVAATFVSNPFTTPAIIAGAYYLGALALGAEPGAPAETGLAALERASSLGVPLLAGLGMLATVASVAGFLSSPMPNRPLARACCSLSTLATIVARGHAPRFDANQPRTCVRSRSAASII